MTTRPARWPYPAGLFIAAVAIAFIIYYVTIHYPYTTGFSMATKPELHTYCLLINGALIVDDSDALTVSEYSERIAEQVATACRDGGTLTFYSDPSEGPNRGHNILTLAPGSSITVRILTADELSNEQAKFRAAQTPSGLVGGH